MRISSWTSSVWCRLDRKPRVFSEKLLSYPPRMDSPARIAFTDFESGFKPQNHILGLILKERLGAVFVDDLASADLLIYSIFGNAAHSFKGPRLFYTEEPVLPRWRKGSYSLTSLRDGTLSGGRHFRFPAWLNTGYIRRTGHIEQYSSVPGDIVNRHENSVISSIPEENSGKPSIFGNSFPIQIRRQFRPASEQHGHRRQRQSRILLPVQIHHSV